MNQTIEAIFLDVGNTLRIVVKDESFQTKAKQDLAALVGTSESPDDFIEILAKRYKVLRKRAKEKLIEASEKEMWTKWMLPDYPEEKIAPLSGKLTRLWRDRDGRRVARADARETIIELNRRGYLLGIIANTITETEIPDWMEEDGVTDYFKTVILSSKVGVRKPGPEIYLEAARQIEVEPSRCAYVGDNPSRDVVGARLAEYGKMIIINEPDTLAKEPPTEQTKPDCYIDQLIELLDIFPARLS
jgi:HAD superfamily hydrolase (TIGR01662 family)